MFSPASCALWPTPVLPPICSLFPIVWCPSSSTTSYLYLFLPPRIGYIICETQYRMKMCSPAPPPGEKLLSISIWQPQSIKSRSPSQHRPLCDWLHKPHTPSSFPSSIRFSSTSQTFLVWFSNPQTPIIDPLFWLSINGFKFLTTIKIW